MTDHFYSVAQAAEMLDVSNKTIYRHLKLGYFSDVVIIKHGQRNDYFFSKKCLAAYAKDLRKTINEV